MSERQIPGRQVAFFEYAEKREKKKGISTTPDRRTPKDMMIPAQRVFMKCIVEN